MDPEIDFRALFAQFDTMLLGRKTFEEALKRGHGQSMPGIKSYVFSRKLAAQDHPGVTILADGIKEKVTSLKTGSGKDIWLMGGGELFRSLLDLGLVDTVEVAIVPVVLGGGIPLASPPGSEAKLQLTAHRVYKKTGIVSLEYAVRQSR